MLVCGSDGIAGGAAMELGSGGRRPQSRLRPGIALAGGPGQRLPCSRYFRPSWWRSYCREWRAERDFLACAVAGLCHHASRCSARHATG